MVRSDAVSAFPGPAPTAATESDGQLDVLEELSDLVSFTGGHADRTSDFAEIRVVGMQDRHLPPVPSVFLFRHDYLLPIQLISKSDKHITIIMLQFVICKNPTHSTTFCQ